MNSREKGKRGERQWRDELRANGYAARRGQQFAGSADSPDVVCEQLRWIHFEVKAVERLNIEDAMEQARRDCQAQNGKRERQTTSPGPLSPCGEGNDARMQKVPIVAHRRSFRPWLVTMTAETFFRLLRGDFTGENRDNGEQNGEAQRFYRRGAKSVEKEATSPRPSPPAEREEVLRSVQ